ncbi:MAG TPA: hypothetical protein VHG91_02240 [Longimicrobium sp.]|nr:hypothetical protein [Longimicrobium sp.]
MAGGAKAEVRRLLAKLPDSCTLEDIQYHIYILQKMKRSEKDSATGCVYTHEEVEVCFGDLLGGSPRAM